MKNRKEQILNEIQKFKHDLRGLEFLKDLASLYDSVDSADSDEQWLPPTWNSPPNHWKKSIFHRIKNKHQKVLSIFELKVFLKKMLPERYERMENCHIRALLALSCIADNVQKKPLAVVKNGKYQRWDKDHPWEESEPPYQFITVSEVVLLSKDILRKSWSKAESLIWYCGKSPPPF